MVQSSAPGSPKQETKSLEAIKEEARKFAFPENASQPPNGQVTEPQGVAQTNGKDSPRGFASLPAKPAGFSQTGELVGYGPASVAPDPNNPSLPPREVSKSIPCRFFPNCKYGDHCVFAHLNPGEQAELAKPSPMAASSAPHSVNAGGFYYPGSHPVPPFLYPSQDPHSTQGGMQVPMEYSHYMAAMGMPYGAPNGAPYYGSASAPQYRSGNPYVQQPYPPYGYMLPPPQALENGATPAVQTNGVVKSPQHSPSNVSPDQAYAPPLQNGAHSPPVDMYQSPVQNGIPNGYGMTNAAPSTFSQPPQQYNTTTVQQPPISAPRQPRTDAVMAASGLQNPASPNGIVSTHRKRNSLSLSTSTNRRSSTAPAGSAYPTSPNGSYPRVGRPENDSAKPKKRSQIACGFFASNECRNGDACEFMHTMADGSDAKQLKQNIIGIDGAIGDPHVLADFKQHREIKDREWKAKGGRLRDTSFPPYESRGRDRFAHPNGNGDYQPFEYRQNGKTRQQSHSSQRIPNGADFPALPGTPRSESAPRHATPSPEPTIASDTDEKMASSIASLMSIDSHKTLGSFASAAARGAQVPQPTASSRKLTATMAKATDSSPHSPVTTAQNLSPDLAQGSPLLAPAAIAA